MFGDGDIIVNPRQWQVMQACLPEARIERFMNAGHFSVLDAPQACMQKLKNFLDYEAPK